jgi:uncharacterized cupredoxin-like copper-binding protein
MNKLILFAFLTAVSLAPASAAPAVTNVDLANFSFAPNAIQLQAGVPTVLHLRNIANGGHSFTAPEFFAHARIQPQSAALVQKGKVEVPGRSAVDIALTPAAGQYPLKCSHPFHAGFGMKGTIVVR